MKFDRELRIWIFPQKWIRNYEDCLVCNFSKVIWPDNNLGTIILLNLSNSSVSFLMMIASEGFDDEPSRTLPKLILVS